MHVYTIERLILSIPVLLLGIIMIFLAVRVVAGSAINLMAANRAGELVAAPKQVEWQLAGRMKPDK